MESRKNGRGHQFAGVHHVFLRTSPQKRTLLAKNKTKAEVEVVNTGTKQSVVLVIRWGGILWDKAKTVESSDPRKLSSKTGECDFGWYL